jgi:hypothetical protein
MFDGHQTTRHAQYDEVKPPSDRGRDLPEEAEAGEFDSRRIWQAHADRQTRPRCAPFHPYFTSTGSLTLQTVKSGASAACSRAT